MRNLTCRTWLRFHVPGKPTGRFKGNGFRIEDGISCCKGKTSSIVICTIRCLIILLGGWIWGVNDLRSGENRDFWLKFLHILHTPRCHLKKTTFCQNYVTSITTGRPRPKWHDSKWLHDSTIKKCIWMHLETYENSLTWNARSLRFPILYPQDEFTLKRNHEIFQPRSQQKEAPTDLGWLAGSFPNWIPQLSMWKFHAVKPCET